MQFAPVAPEQIEPFAGGVDGQTGEDDPPVELQQGAVLVLAARQRSYGCGGGSRNGTVSMTESSRHRYLV
jgi:hypothetical protein